MADIITINGDARFLFRSDTLKNWETENPILLPGEKGVVTGLYEVGDGLEDKYKKIKYGDGVHAWNDLPWYSGGGAGQFTKEGGEIFNAYEGEDLNRALDAGAHAEGRQTVAGKNAHAEGRSTQANGNASHAEGNHSVANGNYGAHAEGRETLADADSAHAEGQSTKALAINSHAEGEMSEARGSKSHSEGTKTKAIANSSHAQGRESVAGTKAFEIVDIQFTPKEDAPEEEPVGAIDTYYVSENGDDAYDGKAENTPVSTIAKAVELANLAGYATDDVIMIKLIGSAVDVGVLPSYKFNLIVESLYERTTATLSSGVSTIANNEGATTAFKNVKILHTVQWASIFMSGSKVRFDSECEISGYFPLLCFGTSNDNGAAKTVSGQNIVIECKTPNYISLSNSAYAAKTYTEDVNFTIDNSESSTNIYFNAYSNSKPSGTTTYQKNVNLNLKNIKSISFGQLENAIFEGALQIINSSRVLISRWTEGLEQINTPMWILTNQSGYDDLLSFTETAGVYKVKDGYTVTATNDLGDVVVSKDGTLDLSGTDGMYSFEITGETKFEGLINLSSVTGLMPEMKVSIKSTSNQDFLINAGTIKAIEGNVLKVEGYPSQLNRFSSSGDNYLFVLMDPTLGDTELGDSSTANGTRTKAIGNSSYTNGEGTIAVGDAQYVCGTYNDNRPNTVFELGCGTSENNRANAFEVYKDGTISIYGTKITRSNLRRLLELII